MLVVDFMSIIRRLPLAEQYLVKVMHHSTTNETFNQLRFELYVDNKLALVDLPLTSFSLAGHLLHCHYVIRQSLLLLYNGFSGDVKRFGCIESEDDVIVPDNQLRPLPDYYTIICGCKKGCSGRCKRVRNATNCSEFCSCRAACDNKR